MAKKKAVHSAIYGVIEKSDLPKTVKKKALAGIVRIEKTNPGNLTDGREVDKSHLSNSFVWYKTKEGHDYWEKLHSRMHKDMLY